MKQFTMDQRYALMEEWKQSGKSVSQFCMNKNLKATTFHGWRKRYDRKTQSLIEVPVKMSKEPNTPKIGAFIELQWKSYRIKLNRDFDSATLKKLIHTLEQCND